MAHGYSLRPNTKGRRSYQNTDETDHQVEGTSTGTTTSNSSTSKGQHKSLTGGDSSTVDPIPATPDTPRAAHNSPRYSHSSVMVTSSAISATADTITSRNRRVEEDHHRPGETWEEIEAARKREEARRSAEVIRIRQEQLVQGYEDELVLLRKRIVALRDECEEVVKQLREEWEEAQAFERGEVLVVVEDPRLGPGHGRGGKKKNHGPHPQPQPQLQPLQRQPTRLMAMPTSSSSSSSSHHGHGLHHTHTHTHTYGTYGTPAVLPVDPGTEVRFGGTDGDNDSEMDGSCSD